MEAFHSYAFALFLIGEQQAEARASSAVDVALRQGQRLPLCS